MSEYFNNFNNLEKNDLEFLMYIAKNASLDIDVLFKILRFSQSDYIEYPLDETEYSDINEEQEDNYQWIDESPVRISIYGRTIDFAISEIIDCIIDNEIRNDRLVSLTIDFGNDEIENPIKLFSAVDSALQIFGEKLLLETLCFCQLEKLSNKIFPHFSVKLPFLKNLILNRVKFTSIDFLAAPRLESIAVISSGVATYDFSRLLALKEVCIGCSDLSKIILPKNNRVNKITIGRGDLPTVKEKINGIGSNVNDIISNIGFSVEYLSVAGCGISKVDLSLCSNLKDLNLSNNPINKLNLAWVPGLEYLNIQNTGINNLETSELKMIKHIFSNSKLDSE